MTVAGHDSVDEEFGSGGLNAVADPHIPGYRIEGLIGSGGMASVYLAIQESLQRPVALKVLDDPESPEYQERLLNEGRIIASLAHANIITVHDIGIANGHLYISMEYVEGGDLRRRIRDGMTPPEAFEIVENIGEALKLAHSRAVIHRDVKPANILFRLDGTTLLADFGVAKDFERDSGLTMDGSVVGSPYYLCPELTRAQTVDGRADIYSLGIILFEMLTGEKPFKGESALDTLFKHLNDPVPVLPEELVRLQYIIDKMLAKEPEDRFANVDEMLAAVREITTRGFDEIADRMVHGTDTMLLEATWIKNNAKGPKRKRARKLARIASLAAGLCMLALGGSLYFGGQSEPAEFIVAANREVDRRDITSPPGLEPAGKVTQPSGMDSASGGATPSGTSPAPAGETSSARSADTAETETGTSAPTSSQTLSPAASQLAAAAPPAPSDDRPAISTSQPRTSNSGASESTKPRSSSSKPAKTKTSTSNSRETKSGTSTSAKAKSRKIAKAKTRKSTTTRPRRTKTNWELEVEYLQAMAQKRLRQGRLHKPLGDNAMFYRDQLVKLDAGSPATRSLSRRIADQYQARAEKQLADGDYFAARDSIDRGLEIAPHDKGLRALDESALKQSARGFFDNFTRSLTRGEPRRPPSGPISGSDR